MAPLILDEPSIDTAIKASLLLYGLTSKFSSKKTLGTLKLLSTIFGVSLKRTSSIN